MGGGVAINRGGEAALKKQFDRLTAQSSRLFSTVSGFFAAKPRNCV
jgi:hypothetical protein